MLLCEPSRTLLTFPICYPCVPTPHPFLIFSSCQDPSNPPATHRLCGGWELGATRIAGLPRGREAHRLPRRRTQETLLTRGECGCLDITHLSHQLLIFTSPRNPVCFVHYSWHWISTGIQQVPNQCSGVEEIWLQIRALQGACRICRSLGCIPGLRVQVSAWRSRHLEHPLGSAVLPEGRMGQPGDQVLSSRPE